MTHNVQTKKITLSNGYSLDFEHPVKDTLVVDDIIIILVESPFDIEYQQNVFAIRSSGDFLWRIGDVKFYYDGPEYCPYIGVEINKDKELVLFNWCDTGVIVDVETGIVIRTYNSK